MKSSDLTLAYAAAILHTLITGFSFLFVKIALVYTNPLHVLSFRFTASFLALMILILLKKVHLNYREKNIQKLLLLSILYPIAFFGFQTFGLFHTSSSEAGIIQSATPIFTMILSGLVLKEKNTSSQKLSILMTVAGVVYIFIMKGAGLDLSEGLGIILLLCSIFSMSGYLTLARATTKQFSVVEISFMMNFVGFIILNLVAVIDHILKGNIHLFFEPVKNVDFIISILYLGILSSLITSMLNNFALKRLEASKVSVFANLRTVVTIIAGVVFLKEKLYLYHIIGSLMIVLGVMGTNYTRHIQKHKQKEEEASS